MQLMSLRRTWEGLPVVYSTVSADYAADVQPAPFFVIADGNMQEKLSLLRTLATVLTLIIRVRPSVVISTGAAPGYFAIIFGKLMGARTVWIDSIANGDELSLSGRKVRRFADAWLTQWPHLATSNGPYYEGSVL